MKRKQMVMMIWGAAALTLGSCSKEALRLPGDNDGGQGTLHISAVTAPQLAVNGTTRAEEGQIELTKFMGSAAAKFDDDWVMTNLRARVQYVEEENGKAWGSYTSADAYNDENPFLSPVPAYYNVTLGMPNAGNKLYAYTTMDAQSAPWYRHNNPTAKLVPAVPEGEGIEYIYFEGWKEVLVPASNRNVEVEVEVKVANTAVTVEFSDNFRNYFASGATVTLKTKNGLTKVIASYAAGQTPEKHYFWVRPQEFTLSAVATPQSPSPGKLDAEPIPLDDVVRTDAEVEPQTLYTFRYDVTNTTGALDGKIVITVNDTPVGYVDLGVEELNPNNENFKQE